MWETIYWAPIELSCVDWLSVVTLTSIFLPWCATRLVGMRSDVIHIYYGIIRWDDLPLTLITPFCAIVARCAWASTSPLFSHIICWKVTWGISLSECLFFLTMFPSLASLDMDPFTRILIALRESPSMMRCWICLSLANKTPWRRAYSLTWLLVAMPKLHTYLTSISPWGQRWPLPHLPHQGFL